MIIAKHSGIDVREWRYVVRECPNMPLNGKRGEVMKLYKLTPQDNTPGGESKQSVREACCRTSTSQSRPLCMNYWSIKLPLGVEGMETRALTDIGAEVSTIMDGLYNKFRLAIHPLGELLCLEETGGSLFPTKDALR